MTMWILFAVFSCVMVGTGIWGMKHTTSLNDFVLGGRNIGHWILAISFGTSYFSAVVFIGFAGKLGWHFGLNVLWIAIGNALFGGLLAWLVLGRRTRRMTHRLNAMTMPEFFEQRYASSFMKIIAAIIIFIFLLPYSASVFKGLGHLFEVSFGISYWVAVLMMTALTGVYLVLGGYIAASRTDFIQGIVMIIGAVAIVTALLVELDLGFAGAIEKAKEGFAAHSGQVMPSGPTKFWLLASLVFMTSFGTWGLPQMVQKYYAIKDEKMIGKGAIVTCLFAIIVVTSAYFSGALAHAFVDQVPEGNYDMLMPALFQ